MQSAEALNAAAFDLALIQMPACATGVANLQMNVLYADASTLGTQPTLRNLHAVAWSCWSADYANAQQHF